MSSYFDSDVFLKSVKQKAYPQSGIVNESERKISLFGIMEILTAMPTADVVAVVRCRDCVNWQKDWSVDLYGSHYCPCMDTRTMGDDYCSYGERREDELHKRL